MQAHCPHCRKLHKLLTESRRHIDMLSMELASHTACGATSLLLGVTYSEAYEQQQAADTWSSPVKSAGRRCSRLRSAHDLCKPNISNLGNPASAKQYVVALQVQVNNLHVRHAGGLRQYI